MRHVYFLAGVCLFILSTVGPSLAAPPKKPPPPKKPAPKVHHDNKPAPKPKLAHAPKPHVPHKKAAPKVAAKAKPLVKPATHHATGPAHKQAKHTAIANKKPEVKPENALGNKQHRPPVNGVVSHSVKTSHGWHEFNSHHFAEFNKEKGAYSFHSHWWHSFVTNPSGWSSNWSSDGTGGVALSGGGDSAPVGGGVVSPTVANLPAPPVIRVNQGLPMSKEGRALAAALDGMDVENHWLAGQRVDWKTGNSIDEEGSGTTSNGGAFVAAVGARFKLPMPASELANFQPGNQFEWLLIDGKAKGWMAMGEVEAQLLANQGWIVIAAWKNSASAGERKTSGMTAIVRPDSKPVGDIAKNGPRVILAGDQNRNNVALNEAFPASAWDNREVVFLAHRQ